MHLRAAAKCSRREAAALSDSQILGMLEISPSRLFRDDLPPRGHLAISGDIFGFVTTGGVLLASGGCRPEMLLNTPPRTAHPSMKNYSALNISSAKVKKPLSRGI